MRALSSGDILRTWESGAHQHSLDRALILLTVTGESREELECLSIGERDRRLWALREATFGSAVEALTQCPACEGKLEFQFMIPDVLVPAAPASQPEYQLEQSGWSFRFRLPQSRDLAAIATANDPAGAEAELARRCLVSSETNGCRKGSREVPSAAWEAVQRKMFELDPQAEVRFDLMCPACNHRWQLLFDIAHFLWTEVDSLARRLLREVDLLARTYGWSEAAILDLKPARRHAYLELVRS
jgi:hypothetical protein